MKRTLITTLLLALFMGVTVHTGRSAVEIADSNPADGSSLAVLPSLVETWSADPLDPVHTQVIVVAPNGARIDSGMLDIDANEPTHFATTLSSGGLAGHYTVHLLSGEPNTASERSARVAFDLTADSGCDGQDDAGAGCVDSLPEVLPGEEIALADGTVATAVVSSENAGPVDITVTLRDSQGNPLESAKVWVRATHLEMDHGEFPHAAVLNEEGSFEARHIGMGMEGAWRLAVDVITADGEPPMTFAVPLEMSGPG